MQPRPHQLLIVAAIAASVLLPGCAPEAGTPPATPEKPSAPAKTSEQGAGPDNVRQSAAKPTSQPQGRQAAIPAISYPKDKDLQVASVDGRSITLDEVIQHIDSQHSNGFADYATTKVGQFEIRSPLLATWIRQFADLTALRREAEARGITEITIRQEAARVLNAGMVKFREDYERNQRRAFPSSESGMRALRNKFLKHRGLGLEVKSVLNALVSEDLDQMQADAYKKAHSEAVDGVIQAAHILVVDRDRTTGRLLSGKALESVKRKVADIQRQLEAGAVFEEVAESMSEDLSTKKKGGRLENLMRIDPRMPASFCRAVWTLKNGAWTGPIATRYGQHFVKRVKWIRIRQVLRLMSGNADVRKMVRAHRQEDLLFEVRKERHVTLRY